MSPGFGLPAPVHRELREHLDRWLPHVATEEFSWTLGPIEEALPGFRVRRYAPSAGDPWAYASCGASAVERAGERAEFVLLSPDETPRHVETLAMVAHYRADPRVRLAEGSVVPIGRPWLEGAEADHLLVSKPLPYGPAFEWLETSGGRVRFLWLVPVTGAEAQFASRHGVAALESALERSGVNVVARDRPSVI